MAQAHDPKALLDLVGDIYDAGFQGQAWGEVLAAVGTVLNGPKIAMYSVGRKDREVAFCEFTGWEQSDLNKLSAHFARVDPNYRIWASLPEGKFVTSAAYFVEDYYASEYYNDLMRPGGAHYAVAGIVHRDAVSNLRLSVSRSRRSGPFEDADARLLSNLSPHFRRAYRVGRQLLELDRRRRDFAQVAELFPHPLILLDAQGTPALLNQRAERLLAANDGLALVKGRLKAASSGASDTLSAAIHRAVLTGKRDGADPGAALTIPRPSGMPAYRALVSPLRLSRDMLDLGPQTVCAVVMVADPGSLPRLSTGSLRAWFGFTFAEARLAHALAEGQSLDEVAGSLRLSKETLRAQLKAVFGKTGTRRQAELVRLLAALPGTLERGREVSDA